MGDSICAHWRSADSPAAANRRFTMCALEWRVHRSFVCQVEGASHLQGVGGWVATERRAQQLVVALRTAHAQVVALEGDIQEAGKPLNNRKFEGFLLLKSVQPRPLAMGRHVGSGAQRRGSDSHQIESIIIVVSTHNSSAPLAVRVHAGVGAQVKVNVPASGLMSVHEGGSDSQHNVSTQPVLLR